MLKKFGELLRSQSLQEGLANAAARLFAFIFIITGILGWLFIIYTMANSLNGGE